MDTNQKPGHRQGSKQRDQQEQHEQQEVKEPGEAQEEVYTSPPFTEVQEVKEVAPGAPIVRSNTPRPLPYGTIAALSPDQFQSEVQRGVQEEMQPVSVFPTKPPSAPPLPEEADEYGEGGEAVLEEGGEGFSSLPKGRSTAVREAQEFVWLFEYGLEMDISVLNSPERLDGLALLYGPAVLNGYKLSIDSYRAGNMQRPFVTITPEPRVHTEVWGVLYRVPRRVTEENDDEPSLLDVIHRSPSNLRQAVQVVVHESYRNRELTCVTYSTPNIQQHPQLVSDSYDLDMLVRRLITIARKQKLPDRYIEHLTTTSLISASDGSAATGERDRKWSSVALAPESMKHREQPAEQNTEPLSIPVEKLERKKTALSPSLSPLVNPVQRIPLKASAHQGLMAFAVYLFCLLLLLLTFAVLQGMGIASDMLTPRFAPLHVPWLVLVYGLLGGCLSSIVTLGRSQPSNLPSFVLITWFTRPFVGGVLALFAYLLLGSGLFIAAGGMGRHEALFLLVGALAGGAEGWLFLRKG